jgi:predicted membrane protein (TIGR00267 family)
VVDGLSPALAALFVLIPFFASALFTSIRWIYFTALGVALLVLFGLGLFLGYVSRKNILPFGVRTVIAGLISILISFLLGE